jgi:hypothetical protein
MLEISLNNPDLYPIWNLLGTDIFLTYENSKPYKIDETKLTYQQKYNLAQAIKSNIIKVHNRDVIGSNTFKSQTQLIEETRFNKIQKMRDFLNQQLKLLKSEIKNQTISDLHLLLDEEKQGKARKSVIEIIQKSISKHQKDVFEQLNQNIQDIPDKDLELQELQAFLGKAEYTDRIKFDLEDDKDHKIIITYGVNED